MSISFVLFTKFKVRLYFSKKAIKSLNKLKKSDIKLSKRIIKKITELQKDPNPAFSIDLVNFFPFKRVKIGKYRIVYKYNTKILNIAFIDKREDVYKNLFKLNHITFLKL